MKLLNENKVESKEIKTPQHDNENKEEIKVKRVEENENWFTSIIEKVGMSLGSVISLAYDAGRESVNTVIKSVLPFMVFVGVFVTIIIESGIGNAIANTLKPLAGSLPGLIFISIICGIPFLSPLLGPGAAIAQVIGVLLGSQIAMGTIPPRYALPAFLISRQITGPIAVIVTYFMSIGLY